MRGGEPDVDAALFVSASLAGCSSIGDGLRVLMFSSGSDTGMGESGRGEADQRYGIGGGPSPVSARGESHGCAALARGVPGTGDEGAGLGVGAGKENSGEEDTQSAKNV